MLVDTQAFKACPPASQQSAPVDDGKLVVHVGHHRAVRVAPTGHPSFHEHLDRRALMLQAILIGDDANSDIPLMDTQDGTCDSLLRDLGRDPPPPSAQQPNNNGDTKHCNVSFPKVRLACHVWWLNRQVWLVVLVGHGLVLNVESHSP